MPIEQTAKLKTDGRIQVNEQNINLPNKNDVEEQKARKGVADQKAKLPPVPLNSNGKFDISEAGINFSKGLISGISNLIESFKKHPYLTSGFVVGVTAAVIMLPTLAVPLVAFGFVYSGYKLLESAYYITKAIRNGNGDIAEKQAMHSLGEAVFAGATSAIAARPALNAMNIETKGITFLNVLKEVAKPVNILNSFKIAYQALKGGNITNAAGQLARLESELSNLQAQFNPAPPTPIVSTVNKDADLMAQLENLFGSPVKRPAPIVSIVKNNADLVAQLEKMFPARVESAQVIMTNPKGIVGSTMNLIGLLAEKIKNSFNKKEED